MLQQKVVKKSKERPLHLLVKNGDKKTIYVIEDYNSITIMWSEVYQNYIISFNQFRKRVVVSTKHFNIMGKCFDEVY